MVKNHLICLLCTALILQAADMVTAPVIHFTELKWWDKTSFGALGGVTECHDDGIALAQARGVRLACFVNRQSVRCGAISVR